MSILKSRYNKGFEMTFENGLSICVQFGYDDYCASRDVKKHPGEEMKTFIHESINAEVIIWDSKFVDYKFLDDANVNTYVSPDKVAEWIYRVSKATSLNDI